MRAANLVIDGGQSACRVAVIEDGEVVETCALPGLSYQNDSEGLRTVTSLLIEVRAVLDSSTPLEAAWLGLSGMPGDSSRRAAIGQAAIDVLDVNEAVLSSDLAPAYVGALGLRPGGVVSAGSGAVTLAMSKDGRLAQVGGHGALVGDQGSAYWIGRAALRAVVKASDGWGPPTCLGEAAEQRYGPIVEIPALLRTAHNPVDEIAQFATIVCEAGSSGDGVAGGIVRRAGQLLAQMLDAAVRQAAGEDIEGMALSWSGRLLSDQAILRQTFEESLSSLPAGRLGVGAPSGSTLEGLQAMAAAASIGHLETVVHRERKR
jgi:N-acetylglucosamine kinase-like BadF-type ATPase